MRFSLAFICIAAAALCLAAGGCASSSDTGDFEIQGRLTTPAGQPFAQVLVVAQNIVWQNGNSTNNTEQGDTDGAGNFDISLISVPHTFDLAFQSAAGTFIIRIRNVPDAARRAVFVVTFDPASQEYNFDVEYQDGDGNPLTPAPLPTLTPTPGPSPEPTASASPAPSGEPTFTPTPGASEQPTPTP